MPRTRCNGHPVRWPWCWKESACIARRTIGTHIVRSSMVRSRSLRQGPETNAGILLCCGESDIDRMRRFSNAPRPVRVDIQKYFWWDIADTNDTRRWQIKRTHLFKKVDRAFWAACVQGGREIHQTVYGRNCPQLVRFAQKSRPGSSSPRQRPRRLVTSWRGERHWLRSPTSSMDADDLHPDAAVVVAR